MAIRADVVCGRRGDRELHVDVYEPTGPEHHHTAVLVNHGGGWRGGDRKMLQPRCEALAAKGYTVLAVEYRLLDEAPWPAQLHDVKSAVRWTAAHADELEIEPDRIVLQGHSAGGHLALLAASTPGDGDLDADFVSQGAMKPIAAVVAYYPPVQFAVRAMPPLDPSAPPGPDFFAALRGEDGTGPIGMLLGGTPTDQEAAAASPLTYAGPQMPPTITFHGTADILLAPVSSVKLHDKLTNAGVPSELHLVAGASHEFDATPTHTVACVAAVDSFLRRYVLDPEGFARESAATNPMFVRLPEDG